MTPTPRRTTRPSAAGPALLAVDVGNSETAIGVFQEEELVLSWRVTSHARTPDETLLLLRQLLAPESLDLAGLPAVLCSVVPPVTGGFARALEALTGHAPVVVGRETVPSMAIRYLDPSAVGPDRLANAVAVREYYGTPAIVVDLGTATTFDVVGQDGDYLGGAIAPGLWTSVEGLLARAARLARVELKRPECVVGRTTEESLQAGVLFGHAGVVEAIVTRILHELGGRAHVVATGGLARLVASETQCVEHVDEALTLKGLRLIHHALEEPRLLEAWTKKQEARRALRAKLAREAPRDVAREIAREVATEAPGARPKSAPAPPPPARPGPGRARGKQPEPAPAVPHAERGAEDGELGPAARRRRSRRRGRG